MAEKEDKSLIGFNPLAWMNEEPPLENDKSKDVDAVIVEINVENKQEFEGTVVIADNNAEQSCVEIAETKVVVNEKSDVIDDIKVVLNATLNIQGVSALYEQLLKLIKSENIIEIDASAVTSIDTSTLQLLIVLKQTASKLDKEVIIDFPSDKFIESAELLGLSEMLGVDQAAAGFF